MADEIGVVAGYTVHRPVSGDHMWVVVASANVFRCFFVPRCPRRPVTVCIIRESGGGGGLVEEGALANAELIWSLIELNIAPENAIDELLIFFDFVFGGLTK